MSGKIDRSKVCWSCEAGVSTQATYCPFCGTDLLSSTSSPKEKREKPREETPRKDERFQSQSLEESLASLYKPPYAIRNRQGLGVPDEREEASFETVAPRGENPVQSYKTEEVKDGAISLPETAHGGLDKKEEHWGGVLPLIFLSVGFVLVVLSLLILFFSKEGMVHLEWNSSHWFIYLLIGLPTSYAGVRLLKRL